MKKGTILHDIKIDKLGYKGVGITTLPNGKKLLIKGNNILGSSVSCRITRTKKDYIEAKTVAVSLPSQATTFLTDPPCPYYNDPTKPPETKDDTIQGCGGCMRQCIKYPTQLERKQMILQDSLFGKIFEDFPLCEILPTPQKFGYRNKIECSFGKFLRKEKGTDTFVIDQQRNLGFHRQGEFSKIIDIDTCLLMSDNMQEVFVHLKKCLQDSQLPVYDQKQHQGFFRHLVIREGLHTQQILVNLAVAEQQLTQSQTQQRDTLQQKLQEDNFLRDHITTFCITDNNGLADVVNGVDITTKPLRGEGSIYEQLHFKQKKREKDQKKTMIIEGGKAKVLKKHPGQDNTDDELDQGITKVSFRLSPFSFFQTNTKGAEIMFETVKKYVGPKKGTILDIYCGTGSIGISLLKLGIGQKVVGIDIVAEAIRDAQENATINQCEKDCTFIAQKAENILRNQSFCQEHLDDLKVLIVDPPRAGLHKHVIAFLQHIRTVFRGTFLYISCNPVTFARDYELLYQAGRRATISQPVDMFPQTHHIEMITVLE